MNPSRPGVLFMQKHWDVMRSDNSGGLLDGSQRQLADGLRLRPSTFTRMNRKPFMFVPIKSDGEHFPLDGKLRVYRSKFRR